MNETVDIIKELEKASADFFPESGGWKSSCYDKKEDSWLCHLRDNIWLAKRLQKDKSLEHIELYNILEFVQTSSFFASQRHDYEQRVVKWQIEWMMNDGENWLVPEGFSDDFIQFHEDVDIGFRKGIVATLTAVGMDLEAIEEGIEKNRDLWLEKQMNMAFENRYEPVFTLMNHEMVPADLEHKEAWIKMRKYEYYIEHKNSVDKYGVITAEMQMSNEEAIELGLYLAKKHGQRKQYLEELGETPRIKSGLELQLSNLLKGE